MCVAEDRQDVMAILAVRGEVWGAGKGRLPVIGELTSGGFISHQRNHPSDKNSH